MNFDWLMRICYVFKIKARFLLVASLFSAVRLLGKFISDFSKLLIVKMAFVTDVREFQAALNACLTVRDWETLTSAN